MFHYSAYFCMLTIAAGVVGASFVSMLVDKDFDLNTPLTKITRESAKKLLEVSSVDERSQDAFVKFAN